MTAGVLALCNEDRKLVREITVDVDCRRCGKKGVVIVVAQGDKVTDILRSASEKLFICPRCGRPF